MIYISINLFTWYTHSFLHAFPPSLLSVLKIFFLPPSASLNLHFPPSIHPPIHYFSLHYSSFLPPPCLSTCFSPSLIFQPSFPPSVYTLPFILFSFSPFQSTANVSGNIKKSLNFFLCTLSWHIQVFTQPQNLESFLFCFQRKVFYVLF